MNPYSRACSAEYQRSRAESSRIRSSGWPVCSAISPSTVSTVNRRSSAWSCDVDGRAADAGRALVHEDPRVAQGVPLAMGAGREEELAGAAGQPEGQGGHVVGDQPHGVVDREHRRDRTARGVDPQADVGPRVLGGQQEQLGAEAGAAAVVELTVEDDDPLLEQPAGEVVAQGGLGRAGGVAHDPTVGPPRVARPALAAVSRTAGLLRGRLGDHREAEGGRRQR